MRNKKEKVKRQNEKIKNAQDKFLQNMTTKYSQKTIDKRMHDYSELLNILEEQDLILSDNEDVIKLRDEILNLKQKNGCNYKITTSHQLLYNIKSILTELSSYNGLKRIINPNCLKNLTLTFKAQNELKTYISQKNEPPTIEEINKILETENATALQGMQNIALICVLCYCSVRNSAARTLPISSVRFGEEICEIEQSPSAGVETKFGKNIYSYIIFPNNELKRVFKQYIEELKAQGLTDNDPLFPTLAKFPLNKEDRIQFLKGFQTRNNYLNNLLKNMCRRAGISKNYTVHSTRHFYSKYIKPYLQSADEFEACAMAMGHRGVGLLFSTYGKLSKNEARDRMINIQKRVLSTNSADSFELINQLQSIADTMPAGAKKRILNQLENIKSEFEDVTES